MIYSTATVPASPADEISPTRDQIWQRLELKANASSTSQETFPSRSTASLGGPLTTITCPNRCHPGDFGNQQEVGPCLHRVESGPDELVKWLDDSPRPKGTQSRAHTNPPLAGLQRHSRP